ncbi:MAG: helix-turn-helix domain-containing protein [Myxococcota bacterium]|nr:helix-turn-helix domain-containing protein [Myxococcota bacterium]
MQYGQFCPIAKATEILAEKWTILIVRELLMGGRRFNELQRGLGMISPALLSSRLKTLEDQGLVVRRKIPSQRGFEYYPTESCESLMPVLVAMGEWGLVWARHNLVEEDFDAEFLMFYLERSVDPSKLVGTQTVVRIEFDDFKPQPHWWIVVEGSNVDVCVKDPGREVDIFFKCRVRTLADVWMGDRTWRDAIRSGDLSVTGPSQLTRNINAWLRPSLFAESDRGHARPLSTT